MATARGGGGADAAAAGAAPAVAGALTTDPTVASGCGPPPRARRVDSLSPQEGISVFSSPLTDARCPRPHRQPYGKNFLDIQLLSKAPI